MVIMHILNYTNFGYTLAASSYLNVKVNIKGLLKVQFNNKTSSNLYLTFI